MNLTGTAPYCLVTCPCFDFDPFLTALPLLSAMPMMTKGDGGDALLAVVVAQSEGRLSWRLNRASLADDAAACAVRYSCHSRLV